MKAIINGLLYNTATAKLLGGNGYGYPGDFRYCYESLYIKKSGEYFLHGMGGALSRYGISTGTNEVSGNETIIPMTPTKARAWAEENLDANDFISAFGTPPESGDRITITAVISADTYEKLRSDAEKADMELSKYIERLISADA